MMDRPRFAKTDALVLKQLPLGEADRLLTLFTANYGKLRAVARGIRRPRSHMAGHLESLVYCRVMVTRGRTLDTISGVETLRSFAQLRQDLEGATRALVCVEQVDALTPEGQANYPVLTLLLETLGWLEEGEKDQAISYFNVHLLEHMGYMPELHRCVACHTLVQPSQNAFSPGLGGVICLSCVQGWTPHSSVEGTGAPFLPLSLNTLKVLRYIHDNPYTAVRGLQIKPPLAAELESLLRSYTSYLVERQLKTPTFLQKLRRLGGTPAPPG